jgi:peptidyl-tRNA hydrolase ICT1
MLIDENVHQPYYTSSPPSLLITSSLTRSAAHNRLDALERLHALVLTTAREMIIKPTSDDQRERVRAMMRREEAARKAEKARRGKRKTSRRKGAGGGWD